MKGVNNLKTRVLGVFFLILLYLGLYSVYLSTQIYYHTLIHWSIPILIWLSSTIVLAFLTKSLLPKGFFDSYIGHIGLNLWTTSLLMTYLFLSLNFYYPSPEKEIYQANIIKTGFLSRPRFFCYIPYANVKFQNKVKTITFPCKFDIEKYQSVHFTLQNGAFGYRIISKKKAYLHKAK